MLHADALIQCVKDNYDCGLPFSSLSGLYKLCSSHCDTPTYTSVAIPGVLDLHGNVVHVEMIDDLLGEIVRQSTNPAFKDVVASFPEVTHSKLNGQRVYTDFNSTDTCHKSWKRALEVENRLGERCRPVCVYVTSDGVNVEPLVRGNVDSSKHLHASAALGLCETRQLAQRSALLAKLPDTLIHVVVLTF